MFLMSALSPHCFNCENEIHTHMHRKAPAYAKYSVTDNYIPARMSIDTHICTSKIRCHVYTGQVPSIGGWGVAMDGLSQSWTQGAHGCIKQFHLQPQRTAVTSCASRASRHPVTEQVQLRVKRSNAPGVSACRRICSLWPDGRGGDEKPCPIFCLCHQHLMWPLNVSLLLLCVCICVSLRVCFQVLANIHRRSPQVQTRFRLTRKCFC